MKFVKENKEEGKYPKMVWDPLEGKMVSIDEPLKPKKVKERKYIEVPHTSGNDFYKDIAKKYKLEINKNNKLVKEYIVTVDGKRYTIENGGIISEDGKYVTVADLLEFTDY